MHNCFFSSVVALCISVLWGWGGEKTEERKTAEREGESVCVCERACVCTCACVCMHACMHVHAHTCICACEFTVCACFFNKFSVKSCGNRKKLLLLNIPVNVFQKRIPPCLPEHSRSRLSLVPQIPWWQPCWTKNTTFTWQINPQTYSWVSMQKQKTNNCTGD